MGVSSLSLSWAGHLAEKPHLQPSQEPKVSRAQRNRLPNAHFSPGCRLFQLSGKHTSAEVSHGPDGVTGGRKEQEHYSPVPALPAPCKTLQEKKLREMQAYMTV